MKRFFNYFFLGLSLILGMSSCEDESPSTTPEEPSTVTSEKITFFSNQSEPVFGEEGGTTAFSFTTTSDWTLDFDETRAASWLTISPTSGKEGDTTLSITTTANDSYDERRASVTIKSGSLTKSFIVTQKQKDALLVTTNKYEVSHLGDTISVEVKANVDYDATIDDDGKDWITEIATRSLSTSTRQYIISKNENSETREGSITFTNGVITENVKVYQTCNNVVLLSQNNIVVSDKGEDITVELNSNCEYEVEMPNADWIKENLTRAMSTHTLYFTVECNETYDYRETQIIFRSKQMSNIADTLTVTQVQKDAIVIAKNEYEVGCMDENLKLTINTNVDFDVSTSNEWIKYVPETRGLVEKSLNFDISMNTSTESREGEITISSGNIKQVIKVIQQGFIIPFVVKQKEYFVPVEGCKIAVQVTNRDKVTIDLSAFPNDCYKEWYEGIKDDYGILFFSIDPIDRTLTRDGHIILKSTESNYSDTIVFHQQIVSEELHNGTGNSSNNYGAVISYSNGIYDFPIYTNLDSYEIVIINHENTDWIHYYGSQKTDYGFSELFSTDINDSGNDLSAHIAFIGNNITWLHGVTKRRQLFILFEEPDIIYVDKEGGYVTTHAYTEDDNLNIRLEGDDTSWITTESVDDTYIDGVRRINTTFKIAPNQSGKNREVTVVAYNGFRDSESVTIVQNSGETLLLSDANQYAGSWQHDMELLITDENVKVEIDSSSPWITLGESRTESNIFKQILKLSSNDTNAERTAIVTVKNNSITNEVSICQLPESGSMDDASPEAWKGFSWKYFEFKTPYPNTNGTKLYNAIVQDPETLINVETRKVLSLLYWTPEDVHMPERTQMTYVLDNYDGISYYGSNMVVLSNQYIETYYKSYGAKALISENRGVLSHELTHALQLEPKGCGDYGSSKVFHSFIEGIADCVRVLNGGFPNESDRPKGGHYLDSYRYTGFFLAWLVETKDNDFLRKFNKSASYFDEWTFDKGIKYALGESYSVDDLWDEYLKAMGDI